MPLTKLQSNLLRLLAKNRSPDSYIAGGIALNREGPRFSGDIDIFQDGDGRLAEIAVADGAVMAAAGYDVQWDPARGTGKRAANVIGDGGSTRLDWVADSDFRYFPALPDDLFGFVLHPVDLATNKAAAAADRRVPRDIVDLVTIHERILPLGAVISAAVGRFPGPTPEQMLDEIRRRGRFTKDEFEVLAVEKPIDFGELHRRIQSMLESANAYLQTLPGDAVGCVFLDGDQPVQPDIAGLSRYRRHEGARRGHWPSSSEIGSAMLERYVDGDC